MEAGAGQRGPLDLCEEEAAEAHGAACASVSPGNEPGGIARNASDIADVRAACDEHVGRHPAGGGVGSDGASGESCAALAECDEGVVGLDGGSVGGESGGGDCVTGVREEGQGGSGDARQGGGEEGMPEGNGVQGGGVERTPQTEGSGAEACEDICNILTMGFAADEAEAASGRGCGGGDLQDPCGGGDLQDPTGTPRSALTNHVSGAEYVGRTSSWVRRHTPSHHNPLPILEEVMPLQHSTLNPKPETRNPKPETPTRTASCRRGTKRAGLLSPCGGFSMPILGLPTTGCGRRRVAGVGVGSSRAGWKRCVWRRPCRMCIGCW